MLSVLKPSLSSYIHAAMANLIWSLTRLPFSIRHSRPKTHKYVNAVLRKGAGILCKLTFRAAASC